MIYSLDEYADFSHYFLCFWMRSHAKGVLLLLVFIKALIINDFSETFGIYADQLALNIILLLIRSTSWLLNVHLNIIKAHRNRRGGGAVVPQIFAKVDLLQIDNDSEKKKGAKKHKPYQIPRKLLLTLLLST